MVARGVVADFLPEATAREIDLGFSLAESVAVLADPLAVMSGPQSRRERRQIHA